MGQEDQDTQQPIVTAKNVSDPNEPGIQVKWKPLTDTPDTTPGDLDQDNQNTK